MIGDAKADRSSNGGRGNWDVGGKAKWGVADEGIGV